MLYELRVVRERRPEYAAPPIPCTSPSVMAAAMQPHFAGLDREQFVVVALDGKNQMLGFHVVSIGTLTASLVHARECFKVAILANAAAIIVMHNHPSGDPTPSVEDVAVTRRLEQAGEILGVRVLDHIVLGDGNAYMSFADKNLLGVHQDEVTRRLASIDKEEPK